MNDYEGIFGPKGQGTGDEPHWKFHVPCSDRACRPWGSVVSIAYDRLTPGQKSKLEMLWDMCITAPRTLDETFPVSAIVVHTFLESPDAFEDWWEQHGETHGKLGRDFIKQGANYKVSLNIAATLFMGGQTTPIAMALHSRMAEILASMHKDPVKMMDEALTWCEENAKLDALFGGLV